MSDITEIFHEYHRNHGCVSTSSISMVRMQTYFNISDTMIKGNRILQTAINHLAEKSIQAKPGVEFNVFPRLCKAVQ